MIDASFVDQSKIEGFSQVVIEKDKKAASNQLMHPSYDFAEYLITNLDYDEYNTAINLLRNDLTVVQVPLLHRNTVQFMGMAERNFYLCTRRRSESVV